MINASIRGISNMTSNITTSMIIGNISSDNMIDVKNQAGNISAAKKKITEG
jgi:hypothetical protein